MTRDYTAEREAFRQLIPAAKVRIDDKTGKAQLVFTWEKAAQTRAVLILMRAAFDDEPAMTARFDELLQDLDEA